MGGGGKGLGVKIRKILRPFLRGGEYEALTFALPTKKSNSQNRNSLSEASLDGKTIFFSLRNPGKNKSLFIIGETEQGMEDVEWENGGFELKDGNFPRGDGAFAPNLEIFFFSFSFFPPF